MNRSALDAYCRRKAGATECFPYGDCIRAYKVGGKMFVFFSLEGELSISLKSDPLVSEVLRKKFPKHITAGFFNMQKKHWNTIKYKSVIDDDKIFKLLDESYELIVQSLTLKEQAKLK